MLHAALTFWLFVIVLCAWGVHALWSALFKPRVVNGALLPGTLVAQLGHVVGLLVTGNAVRNAELMSDDDKGGPKAESPQRQRIPILGSIVVGLLPLLACAGGLYLAARLVGGGLMHALTGPTGLMLPQSLPASPTGVFELLRTLVGLMESVWAAVAASDLRDWHTLLFWYLAVCLTVRMAPFEGHQRGALGAIALTGVVSAVGSAIAPRLRDFIASGWPVLSFAVASLLLLLLISLAATGLVRLVRMLAQAR